MEDAATVKRRWKQILGEHPASSVLWRAFLAHRMTTFAEFRAGDVRGDFRDALHALSSARLRRLHDRGGDLDDEVLNPKP